MFFDIAGDRNDGASKTKYNILIKPSKRKVAKYLTVYILITEIGDNSENAHCDDSLESTPEKRMFLTRG